MNDHHVQCCYQESLRLLSAHRPTGPILAHRLLAIPTLQPYDMPDARATRARHTAEHLHDLLYPLTHQELSVTGIVLPQIRTVIGTEDGLSNGRSWHEV